MCEYKYLSEIYDISMEASGVDYDIWCNKIFENIPKDLQIKNILELGCGTGNITTKLLEKGYEVVGIDKSSEMLEIADEKTKKYGQNIILIQQDITDIDFDIYQIDMITAVNDLVNYITDSDDLLRIFEFAYQHLKDGGAFVFDISSDYKIINILGNNTFFEETDAYCMVWQNIYFEDEKIIDMYIDIFKNCEDDIYKRYQEVHTQRAYNEQEIEDLLKNAGFCNIKKQYYTREENIDLYNSGCERIFYTVIK